MLSRSYKVLPTQETLDRLADRIERAYALRRSNWYRGCSTPRVWSAAATILWEAHSEDPTIPLDPELFVASQPLTGTFADPWSSLAQTEAGHRYKQNVRRIIRRLRTELKREIRLTEDLLRQGRTLSMIIGSRNARLSPLGLYIAAQSCGPPGPRRTPPARCHRATQLLPSLPLSMPGFPAGGTLPDGSVEPQRRSQGNLRASARNRLLQLELKSRRQLATCGQPVDSRSKNHETSSWDEVATCSRRAAEGGEPRAGHALGPSTVLHSRERLRMAQPGSNRMERMRSLGPR